MAKIDALVFRASLDAAIHRDIAVAADSTLYALAAAIIASFDFDLDHAFGFYSKLTGHIFDSPRRYELFADMGEADPGVMGVEKTPATDAFPSTGSKMILLFDYGDDWTFQVELIERRPRAPGEKLPLLLASAGQAPEQYPADD
jgi:hypothetical protein